MEANIILECKRPCGHLALSRPCNQRSSAMHLGQNYRLKISTSTRGIQWLAREVLVIAEYRNVCAPNGYPADGG